MNIYFGLEAVPVDAAWEGAAVTIGVFDGVHLGHQALIARTVQNARTNGIPAIVLTFDRHPAETVYPESAPPYIHTISHRLERLAECGVDQVVLARFDSGLASTPPGEFVEQVLVRQLRAQHLILGDDFRFGRGREGHIGLLRAMGESHGFEVHVVASVMGACGVRVSSSHIRERIQAGEMGEVLQLMGVPWRWTGTVVRGGGRGTGFGFPTANLKPVARLVSPREGVYACRARLGGQWYAAAVSAGTKPMFPGSPPGVEAYLIDFEHRSLYGCTMDLQFIQFLREQWAFESTDALLEQIHRDVEQTRAIIR